MVDTNMRSGACQRAKGGHSLIGHRVRLMPPAYVERHRNDAANAEAICEAVCVCENQIYNIGDEGRLGQVGT